jgi:hypothetical protein
MKNNFRKIKVSFKSVLQDASETSMQLKINFFDFFHGAAFHAVTQLICSSKTDKVRVNNRNYSSFYLLSKLSIKESDKQCKI